MRVYKLCTFAIPKQHDMATSNFKIGQQVNYSNGNPSIYTGQVVKINQENKTLIVIDDEAGMKLWNAGHSVGSEITFNQVK